MARRGHHMDKMQTPFRITNGFDVDYPDLLTSVDVNRPKSLLSRCPVANVTPLKTLTGFGSAGEVFVKDERFRTGVGSFKALGTAYVIAHTAQNADQRGITCVTASVCNHGISVATGAWAFDAQAVIFLSHQVPKGFSACLEEHGAKVVFAGYDYAQSLEAAKKVAEENGWTLLSDTSWDSYWEKPRRLMEGYFVAAAETAVQIPEPPKHILLQSGVGGLFCAAAAYFTKICGDGPKIIVAEPNAAVALYQSIENGKLNIADGPESSMGRLDCKIPSLIALNGPARDADTFLLISDTEVDAAPPVLQEQNLKTSPYAGVPMAALYHGIEGIGAPPPFLCFVSEQVA